MGIFDFLYKKKAVENVVSSQYQLKVSVVVSEPDKPTDKQLAYARDLSIKILPSMTREQLSHLISDAVERKKPPAEWQIKSASKLGIKIVPGMTCTQLTELINRAEFDRPPSHQQLKKAKTFGVNVSPDLTYGQLGELLDQAILKQPPTSDQVELCDKVGLPLPSGTTRGQAETIISEAKNNPKYASKFWQLDEELQKESAAEEDREQREKYGDKLMEDFYRWEEISSECYDQYVLVFRRGKNIVVEVVEFDSAEIIDGAKPYINLSARVPEKEKLDRNCYVFSWEKEVEIRAGNILHIQKLKTNFSDCSIEESVDSEDYTAYKKVLEKATEFAKRFDPA